MGKRGPAPKGEFSDKSTVFSTRITPHTKRLLDAAARESGRSLSQECERRIRRSFDEDREIRDRFGSERIYRLMCLISDVIQLADLGPAASGYDWLNEQERFDNVVRAINAALAPFRPKVRQESSPPSEEWNDNFQFYMSALASSVLQRVRGADTTLPPGVGTADERRARAIKKGLGPLTDRLSGELWGLDPASRAAFERMNARINSDKCLDPPEATRHPSGRSRKVKKK